MPYLLSSAIARIRTDLSLSSDADTTSLIRNTIWWAVSILMTAEGTIPEDMVGLYSSFEKTVTSVSPTINLKTDPLSVDFMRLVSVRKKMATANVITLTEIPESLRDRWNTNDGTMPYYTVYWYQEGAILKFIINVPLTAGIGVEVQYIKNPPVSLADSGDLLLYFSYGLINKAIVMAEEHLTKLRNAV